VLGVLALLASAARAGDWDSYEAEFRRAARVADDAICLVVHAESLTYANGVVLVNRGIAVTVTAPFPELATLKGSHFVVFVKAEQYEAQVLQGDKDAGTMLLDFDGAVPHGVQFSRAEEAPVGLPVLLLTHDLTSVRTRARNAQLGHVASRVLRADGKGLSRLLVTALVNQGQQGAPVVDLYGRLLGVATGVATGGGQTIVVPVEELARRFEEEGGLHSSTLPEGKASAVREGIGARLGEVTARAWSLARPAVVGVRAARTRDDPEEWDGKKDDGPAPVAGSLPAWDRGSGLIVDPDGWIVCPLRLTGWPRDDRELTVDLADHRSLPATIMARDLRLRIALLRVRAEGLPVLEEGAVDELKAGSFVCVVGSPNWVPPRCEGDLSFGIVSRTGTLGYLSRYFDAIMFDAIVSGANRGGALVDLEGRLLGIVVDPADTEDWSYFERVRGRSSADCGLGFAIPVSVLKGVLPVLRTGEDLSPPFLGVQVKPVKSGLEVLAIQEKNADGTRTAAAAAGLEPGDLLTALGDTRLHRHFDLRRALARDDIGDEVEFTWQRNQITHRASAPLGRRGSD